MVADMTDDRFKSLADQINPEDLKRLAKAENQERTAPVAVETYETPRRPETISFDASWTAQDDTTTLRELLLDDEIKVDRRPARTVKWWDIPGMIHLLFLSVAMMAERVYRKSSDIKARFNSLPPLVRGAYLISLALVLLIGVGYFAGSVAYNYYRSHQGPFLSDALVAPFDLAERPMPSSSTSAPYLLPVSLGKYTRTDRPITQLEPSSPTNQCLLGLGYPRETTNAPWCTRSYGMLSTAAAKYRSSNNRFVDVAIAQFPTTEHASVTMHEMLAHARHYGQIGNFAMDGVGQVDYFYSSVRGWVSFTWSRGPWIFSISSNRISTVEDVLPLFTY